MHHQSSCSHLLKIMVLPDHIYRKGWQIAKNPDILLAVTDHLPLKDVLSLLQTSKQIQSFTRYIYVQQYHHLLLFYVDIPYKIWDLVGKHHCIISGSAVVWFIEGFLSSWEPHDLNIYAPRGQSKPIVDYLLTQGYNKVSLLDIPEDDNLHHQFNWHTFRLVHLYNPNMEMCIDVFKSETRDPIHSLLYFCGTHTILWISSAPPHSSHFIPEWWSIRGASSHILHRTCSMTGYGCGVGEITCWGMLTLSCNQAFHYFTLYYIAGLGMVDPSSSPLTHQS